MTVTPPLIVTGHGRSGTHWLAHVLGQFVDARHEPPDYRDGEIVVDCRLHDRIPRLQAEGHNVVHLVRDGRDAVRSKHEFHEGRQSFESCCDDWALVTGRCADVRAVRLEDLTAKQAASRGYRLSHWREWPADYTETFWRICGDGMRRHGYTP
jgi:hypothetical protein